MELLGEMIIEGDGGAVEVLWVLLVVALFGLVIGKSFRCFLQVA